MLTAFCKLASFFNEHIWGWNGHQHDFCVISVIGIHRIINSIRQQWGLNLVLVEDMESGCILDFESVMHRKGFHPRMISHKKVRGDVHIGITFLQIIHITIKENHISMSNFQNFLSWPLPIREVERHFRYGHIVPGSNTNSSTWRTSGPWTWPCPPRTSGSFATECWRTSSAVRSIFVSTTITIVSASITAVSGVTTIVPSIPMIVIRRHSFQISNRWRRLSHSRFVVTTSSMFIASTIRGSISTAECSLITIMIHTLLHWGWRLMSLNLRCIGRICKCMRV